jgi:hypothetical protein
MKVLRRALLAVLFIALALGFAAPYIHADRMRPRIEAALEAALNRKVHIKRDVYLNLFTGPGFTVEDVLIADDSAVGIEPFAHVDSMRARVRLTSLLSGKLVFSSLRLDGPSVNLVKPSSGAWNIQPLLDHPAAGSAAHRHIVPDIQIRDGRLNFKFADTKSVFYIRNADVDIYPNESGDVVIRFLGEPARTDRGSQAFGQLSARGLLRSGKNGEDELNMGVRLERTAISEIARLFNGRDLGVHGNAIANAKLSGPLSNIEITGDLNINDIHRWDLMPAKGEGWTLNYRGLLDFRNHDLSVETVSSEGPVAAKFRLADYLSAPKWTASLIFNDLPAASLVETARHMGAPFPEGMHMDGKVKGGIGYSNGAGVQGELSVENASVKFPRAASAEFGSATVKFADNRISFGPADVRMENGQSAQIEAEYALDDSYAQVKIGTRQLTIAELESSAEHVISAPPIPLLEKLRQGTYKGWIAFERKEDHDGVWSGEYELQNAVMDIPGVATPLRFTTASVTMSGGQIQISRIRAHAGSIKLEGDYRFDPPAVRPHKVRLVVPKLDLAELEQAMLPSLRRSEGFLARTFRIRKEVLPKWLQDREIEGSVQVANLTNGESALGALKARLVWDGPNILLSDVDCRLAEMHAIGKMSLSLAGAAPMYRLVGNIENLDYKNGELDVEGDLETSGIAEQLLLNIRSHGTFEGRGIDLAPDAQFHEIAGSYRVAALAGIPRLLLSNLQVSQGADTFTGQGSSQPDGHLVLELVSGRRQMRLTGMLLPMHPEPTAVR